MSYTPHTWSNGETITAAKLNAIEQGVAGAGGASPLLVTVTGTSMDMEADATYSEAKTAFLAGSSVLFDFSAVTDSYNGTSLMVNFDDGSLTVMMIVSSGTFPMWANTANSNLVFVD